MLTTKKPNPATNSPSLGVLYECRHLSNGVRRIQTREGPKLHPDSMIQMDGFTPGANRAALGLVDFQGLPRSLASDHLRVYRTP